MFEGVTQLHERAREMLQKILNGEAVKWNEEDIRRVKELAERRRQILDEFKHALDNLASKHNNKHLTVDEEEARELAETTQGKLPKFKDASIGTKLYASLLALGRRNAVGLAVTRLDKAGSFGEFLRLAPKTAYNMSSIGSRREEENSRRPSRDEEEYRVNRFSNFLIGLGGVATFRLKSKSGSKVEIEVLTRDGVTNLKIESDKAYFTGALADKYREKFLEEARRYRSEPPSVETLVREAIGWLATDVSFDKGLIAAGTTNPRQFAWYERVFGEANNPRLLCIYITDEGWSPGIANYWPVKRLDDAIARSQEVKLLFGEVMSWHDLVYAIDWDWVVKTVEELKDELTKPSIETQVVNEKSKKREKTLKPIVDRELGEKALSSLKLYAEFMKARKESWTKAIEALSGGRLQGEDAKQLSVKVEEYIRGEMTKEEIEESINSLVEKGLIDKELGKLIAEVVTMDAEFKIARKFVALVYMLKLVKVAEKGLMPREEALRRIGEIYATMVAGDGNIQLPSVVELVISGVLGDVAAFLLAAVLYKAGKLAPEKFVPRVYEGHKAYYVRASGNYGRALAHFIAATTPSVKGEYLLEKFDVLMDLAKPGVKVGEVEKTEGGFKTTLTLELQGQSVTYDVYLGETIRLVYTTADEERLELAARLLKLAGVRKVEVREGRIEVAGDALASASVELRKALVKTIRARRGGEKEV